MKKLYGRMLIDSGLLLMGLVKLWLPLLLIFIGILVLKIDDDFYID